MASIVALRMIKALVRLGWSIDRASGTSHHVLTKEVNGPSRFRSRSAER
jgi:predicted RNA binding protein YcfA (HicA-like mRNA interferase family)